MKSLPNKTVYSEKFYLRVIGQKVCMMILPTICGSTYMIIHFNSILFETMTKILALSAFVSSLITSCCYVDFIKVFHCTVCGTL